MSKYISKCLYSLGEDLDTRDLPELMDAFAANPTRGVASELVYKITKAFSDDMVLNEDVDSEIEELICDVTNIKWSDIVANKHALDKDTIFQLHGLIDVLGNVVNVPEEIRALFMGMISDVEITGEILELIIRDRLATNYPMVDPIHVMVETHDEGVAIRIHNDIEEPEGAEGVVDFVNGISNEILQHVIQQERVVREDDKPTSPLN